MKFLIISTVIAAITSCNQNGFKDDKYAFKTYYPYISINESNASFLSAFIDTNEIMLHLNFVNYSGYHAEVYSVTGWMASITDTLSACGLYEPERLTVYIFENPQQCEDLLNFSQEFETLWEILEYYRYLKGWEQRLVLSDENAYLLKDNDSLEVDLYSPQQRKIKQQKELLQLSAGKTIDLRSFFDVDNDSLSIIESGENYIKIYFTQPSSNYAMGQCGAGIESGYLHLHLDANLNIQNISKELIESCWQDIWEEEGI